MASAVRVVNDGPETTRIEFRLPAADTNPHLALALALGAGLWGIENQVAAARARHRRRPLIRSEGLACPAPQSA